MCGSVDEEKILSEIEEKTADVDYFKSMLNNEESLLSTFKISLINYQDELEDAVIKLEKAKSQKTMRVYYEGVGWVWEADPQRVAIAQDDVEHYTYMVNSQQLLVDSCNKEIEKYKKLIEAIEIEIKELKNKL